MEVAGKRKNFKRGKHTFCDPCKVESKETKANGACRECKEYMCTTCFRHHLKGKLCRNHVLLPTEELSSMSLDSSSEDVEKCGKHDNEPIKFYCRTHDIVGCGDCIVLGHSACRPEYIKDIAKSFPYEAYEEQFKNLMAKVETFKSYNTANEIAIQKNREEMKQMNEKVIKDIQQFRSDINEYLDNVEANVLSDVRKLTLENTQIQRKLEKDVQSLTSEIEEVKQKLNTQLHGGNALFINAVSCKSKLNDIDKMHTRIKQEHSLKRFEFVPDKTVSGILQAAQKFGSLKIDSGLDTRVKPFEFAVDARVRRGPDWNWENEDGGGLGTVTGFDDG